jgi:D-3-phosphoglycerate dehydrogenase
VITDSDFGDLTIESELLQPAFEVRHVGARTEDEIVDRAADAVALLVQWAPVSRKVLTSLPQLKVVVRYGIGLDNVDLKAAKARGVVVRNVDDYCLDEVASHAAAAIAAANRRLPLYNAAVKRGEWGPACVPRPLVAKDDPVGIAGYGRIGSALAARAAAAGHPVVAWDPYASDAIARDGFAEAHSLEELAHGVNHLSLHVPLGDATATMIGASVLERLGPLGHLVNSSRGGLLDETAVLDWLQANEFATASLDVFADEPPTGHAYALACHPRVTASPHVAYLSTESLPRLRRNAARRVLEALTE